MGISRLRDRRFNGYLAVRLPHPLDDEVGAVVFAYMAGSAAVRQAMLEEIGDRAAAVLSVYGQRMASTAVRTGSVEDLRRGVLAVGLAERRLDDFRNNLFVLSTINDSATLIGTSLGALIESLKNLLPPAGLEGLRTFDQREERAKSLEAFGRRRTGAGETFRYR